MEQVLHRNIQGITRQKQYGSKSSIVQWGMHLHAHLHAGMITVNMILWYSKKNYIQAHHLFGKHTNQLYFAKVFYDHKIN